MQGQDTQPAATTGQSELANRRADALQCLAEMVRAHPEVDAVYLGGDRAPWTTTVWCPLTAAETNALIRAAEEHGATITYNRRDDGARDARLSWHGITFAALGVDR